MNPLRCIASSLLFIAFAGTTVVGCTAIQSTPQQQRENLAWSAEDTRIFARFVGEFVKNHQGAATDKTALLARAEILLQHAQTQAAQVKSFEADGSRKSGVTLKDLQARNDGLRRERSELNHEWDVWQVQIGIKKAEDTELSYVPINPADC
ncbi:MAG: hypothetical protein RLY72_939 [Planctomycetota bacterium]|jgi:hypothetical protein